MLIDGERVNWGIVEFIKGKGNEPDDVHLECTFADGEVEYVRLAVAADFVPEEKPQFGENAGGADGHPAYIAVMIAVVDSTAMQETPSADGESRRCIESRIVMESQDYRYFEDYYAAADEKKS